MLNQNIMFIILLFIHKLSIVVRLKTQNVSRDQTQHVCVSEANFHSLI